jgi:hypothetical protein
MIVYESFVYYKATARARLSHIQVLVKIATLRYLNKKHLICERSLTKKLNMFRKGFEYLNSKLIKNPLYFRKPSL